MTAGCLVCGRRLGARAQALYETERDPVALCGAARCATRYNGPTADLNDCACGAHPERAA